MWENLEVEVNICERCNLGKNHENVRIVGQGNKEAEIFFLFDEISKKEAENKLLLEDKNGKLLNKFFKYSNLDIQRCYFTTLTKCYKDDNIVEGKHIKACSGFLDTQIVLIKPKYIISVGEKPTKALIKNQKIDMKKMFGNKYDYFGITVIPIYDISYFLYKMTDKEKWRIANIFGNI